MVCFSSNLFVCLFPIEMQSRVDLFKNQFVFHPTGLFFHFLLSCNVEQHLLKILVCFSSNWFVCQFVITRHCRVAFIEKIGLFIIQLVCLPISIYHSELFYNLFIFYPTGLFASFQLSCNVMQYYLKNWFVFHSPNLFAHFQLS